MLMLLSLPAPARAADQFNLLDYAPAGTKLDRTGHEDASAALSAAIAAANVFTAKGEPACVHIPPGTYRIVSPPPAFQRAGCVRGEGPTQSTLRLDERFQGDLFAWSEAWAPTTPGPTASDLRIIGNRSAKGVQNAFVFYDRNDEVDLDNIKVEELPGRALYSGVSRAVPQAYMRESRIRRLRVFNAGVEGVPVIEFNSQGAGATDATNEIRISEVDIYGSRGPSFVIRNNGTGGVRNFTIVGLRIEGRENGDTKADLLTIGDRVMTGNVNSIRIRDLELVDPYKGFAALRLTAANGRPAPYFIEATGFIGGGLPHGEGLRIDAGRNSRFHFRGIHTEGVNIGIGPGVNSIMIDGDGSEREWTFEIDRTSYNAILFRNEIHLPAPRAPGRP